MQKLAALFAQKLSPGFPLLLSGPLGVGKSTLARELICSFCPGAIVPSPSFPLMILHETSQGLPLWHMDFYRIQDAREAQSLDVERIFFEEMAIVEWPEKLGPYWPSRANHVTLGFGLTEEQRHWHFCDFLGGKSQGIMTL